VVTTRTDYEEFQHHLERFLVEKAGYLEVSKVDSAYPFLALSISGELPVVHRFDNETCRSSSAAAQSLTVAVGQRKVLRHASS
jgi:hypothetical protein